MGEEILGYVKKYCNFSRIEYGQGREDIMQDMAVNILSSIKNYNPTKGNFRNYVYGICSNTEKKYLRNAYRDMDKIPYHIEDLESPYVEKGEEDNYFYDYYAKDVIKKGISLIEKENKNRSRRISTKNMYEYIIMYVQGYSQKEIAAKFNTSQRDVSLRITHFKKAIAKIYNIEV